MALAWGPRVILGKKKIARTMTATMAISCKTGQWSPLRKATGVASSGPFFSTIHPKVQTAFPGGRHFKPIETINGLFVPRKIL